MDEVWENLKRAITKIADELLNKKKKYRNIAEIATAIKENMAHISNVLAILERNPTIINKKNMAK